MKPAIFSVVLLSMMALLAAPSFAQTLYYDTNGTSSGTSTSSTQNFTDSVWTTDSTGSIVTTGYTPDSDVVFSAGSNGTGAQNVTVTDTELADSFTFDKGTVTLYGSGSPNLSLGGGGITVNSTDGATTFDSSLNTVTVAANQSWNNDSTQTLNVNSGVAGSGTTLSFGGTGSGNVKLNGVVSGSQNLTQNSTSSALYLNNNGNSFIGSITSNGGSLVFASQGTLGNGGNNITYLNGGGTASFDNTNGYNAWTNNIVLGTGGGQVDAGIYGGGGIDTVFGGTVTGGTGLSVVGGDFITTTNTGSDVGTLNIVSKGVPNTPGFAPTRLLAGSAGLFGGNAAVNVETGSILDFGWNNYGGTLGNAITLADGSALENRGPGMTLNDVLLPSTGTVTIGSDDLGGGSITITNAIDLTGSLTLDINGTGNTTPVNFSGPISGSGALTINPGEAGNSVLELTGNSNYTGPTTINNATVNPGNTGFGNSTVTLNSAAIDLTGGTLATPFVVGAGTSYIYMSGGNQTISGLIELSAPGDQLNISNGTTANLTVGSIDFAANANPDRVVAFDATNTGSITLNGTYTSGLVPAQGSDGASSLSFGAGDYNGSENSANYYLGATADFSGFESYDVHGKSAIALFAGNLYLENSSFVSGQYISVQNDVGDNHTIYVVGAQTIQASIYTNLSIYPNNIQTPGGLWTLDQSTADSSTLVGGIQHDSQDFTVSVVDGGRLNIVGDMSGYITDGAVKTGGGTVVLSNANGNDYQTGGAVTVDIQQGTLLINNTEAGALGNNNNGTANIEAGATLGGTGSATQQVIAEAATSTLTAGDPGQANLGIKAKIGTLTLSGGVVATSGLTLDFKLDNVDGQGNTPGIDSDLLSIGDLTLGGTSTDPTVVTVNIISLGSIVTGVPYALIFSDTGNWTGTATFDFTTPAGYALDLTYGADQGTEGYIFDESGDSLSVQFVATPEPSIYGLLGLGLLALVAVGRFRRQTA